MYSNLPNPEVGCYYVVDPTEKRAILVSHSEKSAVYTAAMLANRIERPLEVITFHAKGWKLLDNGLIVPSALIQTSVGWFESDKSEGIYSAV